MRAEADPLAICLIPDVMAAFDAEWELVLDGAKQPRTLRGVREQPAECRAFAYEELREPGADCRLPATAAEVQRTGADGQRVGRRLRARVDARVIEFGRPGVRPTPGCG